MNDSEACTRFVLLYADENLDHHGESQGSALLETEALRVLGGTRTLSLEQIQTAIYNCLIAEVNKNTARVPLPDSEAQAESLLKWVKHARPGDLLRLRPDLLVLCMSHQSTLSRYTYEVKQTTVYAVNDDIPDETPSFYVPEPGEAKPKKIRTRKSRRGK